MKKITFPLLLLIMCCSLTPISFTPIINALNSGKASAVASYFDTTVEITLPEKSSSYSKKQASLVLAEFFKNNPVKKFEVIHSSENEGSQYCIGNLSTANGIYRTTIYVKEKNKQQLIQEIRFEQ